MEDRDLLLVIEKLNEQLDQVKRSREYQIGHIVCSFYDKLVHLQFKEMFIGIKNKRKLKKIKSYNGDVNWSSKEIEKVHSYDASSYKIAIYTCITGNYDSVNDPCYFSENVDYFMFSDKRHEGTKWEQRSLPKDFSDNILNNRYVKMHPFELFSSQYDYAIYIDGNIVSLSDLAPLTQLIDKSIGIGFHRHAYRNCICNEIEACKMFKKVDYKKLKEQVQGYIKEGFPKAYGMVEGNLIVVDLKSLIAKEILEDWWNEFCNNGDKRDQISLPYVLWKKGIAIEEVATIGKNIYRNYKLQFKRHN